MSPHKDNPFLIVGLGNPGRRYHRNRHNIGFMFLDHLADSLGTGFRKMQMKALLAQARLHGLRLLLAKPQTWMNRAGESVAPLIRYYKVPLSNVLIVYDDLDLPHAELRLRAGGGSGGHRGLESILKQLGAEHLPRLRIGIGRPPGRMDPADYVLQDFSDSEWEMMQVTLKQAEDCTRRMILEDIERAMTHCNQRRDD